MARFHWGGRVLHGARLPCKICEELTKVNEETIEGRVKKLILNWETMKGVLLNQVKMGEVDRKDNFISVGVFEFCIRELKETLGEVNETR